MSLVLLAAAPAQAITYAEYKALEGEELEYTQIWLAGVQTGLEWANAQDSNDGRPQHYCQPRQLALDPAKALEYMDRYVANYPDVRGQLVDLVLLMALREAFPCGAPNGA